MTDYTNEYLNELRAKMYGKEYANKYPVTYKTKRLIKRDCMELEDALSAATKYTVVVR